MGARQAARGLPGNDSRVMHATFLHRLISGLILALVLGLGVLLAVT
jgi:hypothetical protein